MRIEAERAMFKEAMRNPRIAVMAHRQGKVPCWLDYVGNDIWSVLRPHRSAFIHAPAVVVSEKELKIQWQSVILAGGLHVYYIEDGANVLAELSKDPAIRSKQEDQVLR